VPWPQNYVIRQFLIDQGVLDNVDGDDKWPVTAGSLPATVDNRVSIQNTGGELHPRLMTGEENEYPTFQVMIRAFREDEGFQKASAIQEALMAVGNGGGVEVLVEGTDTYVLQRVHKTSSFSKVGQTDDTRMQLISGNFKVTLYLKP